MAEASMLARTGPLVAEAPVAITLHDPMTRLIARGDASAADRLGGAFGVALPTEAKRAAEAGRRAALWLGPDEWLLLAPEDPGLARGLEAGLAGNPGCVVDVSHRQIGMDVVGPGAAEALNAGCPLDLDPSAFPVGACARTVVGKTEVVLWRRAPDRFHVECWRSFAPYLLAFLQQAAADNAPRR